jgi:hypothetical protein
MRRGVGILGGRRQGRAGQGIEGFGRCGRAIAQARAGSGFVGFIYLFILGFWGRGIGEMDGEVKLLGRQGC